MRVEIAPGVYVHRTTDPRRGICDDCGCDMHREPHLPCKPSNLHPVPAKGVNS